MQVYFLPFFHLTHRLVTNGTPTFETPLALRNSESQWNFKNRDAICDQPVRQIKKLKKIDPHYFSILEMVYFLPFFHLTHCLFTNGTPTFEIPLALRISESQWYYKSQGAIRSQMAPRLLKYHMNSEFYYLNYLINKKELKKTKNIIKLSEFDLICG